MSAELAGQLVASRWGTLARDKIRIGFGALLVFVGIPALPLLTGVTVVRTHLEDQWLHENLDGYPEFATRTRSKLIPGVW